MPEHNDFGLLTFNIALSDPAQFKGGGTWFQAIDATLRPSAEGHGLLHASPLSHCGVPITEGERYVLAVFVISEDHVDVAGRLQAKGVNLRTVSDLGGSAKLLSYAIRANGLDSENWYEVTQIESDIFLTV